ncbi:MAG: HEPN domain-containing protein, partial [bacterium]
RTGDLAPRIHNLARLAELAGLRPDQEQLDILSEMNAFQLEGRYPEGLIASPKPAEAQSYMKRAQEVFEWLKKGL